MSKYLEEIYKYIKITNHNYWHKNDNDNDKIYKNLEIDDTSLIKSARPLQIDNKELRLNILLYIKQYKNIYYKYTNKDKFNSDLYNSYINDDSFDDSLTAYDDDDSNIRIFDKYIIKYIKKRNDIITYLQCKNKNVILHTVLDNLKNINNGETFDILFIIDMPERDILSYCLNILNNSGDMGLLKTIIFSMILNINNNNTRIKIESDSKDTIEHPFVVLENYIT